MEWMILPYRRYFEFSGRSRRREFWMFQLFVLLVNIALRALFGHVYTSGSAVPPWMWNSVIFVQMTGIGAALNGIFALATFIPNLAVAVRRLHDTDRSGWWLLLYLLPLIGWIVILVFFCLDGTAGGNRFGRDPKGRGFADVFR